MPAQDKVAHYMKVDNNAFVELQLKKGLYDDGMAAAIGISLQPPGDEANIVGYGLQDAIDFGATPMRIRYKKTSNKSGYSTIFVSPLELKDVRANILKTRYNGKDVTKVYPPRKICYRY